MGKTLEEQVAELSAAKASNVDDGSNDPSMDSRLSQPGDELSDSGYSDYQADEGEEELGIAKKEEPVEQEESSKPEDDDSLPDDYDFEEPEDETDLVDGEPDQDANKGSNESKSDDSEDGKKPESKDASADKKSVDDEQLARALHLGLNAEEVTEYAKLGELSKILDMVERIRGVSKESSSSVTETSESEILDIKLDLDPEVFDPEFTQELNNQVTGKIAPIIQTLNQKIARLESERNTERQVAFEAQFDSMIDGLGDGYSDLLGKGSGREIKQDGQEMQNRIRVLETMASLAKVSGKSVPVKELFDRALAATFPDRIRKFETDKIRNSLERRKGQIINKPTNRQKTLSPRQSAVQAVAQELAAVGISPSGGGYDEEFE